MNDLKISIIIPAHNESNRIVKTLDDYCSFFPNAEIIVVLNACTDDTHKIIERYQLKYFNLKYLDLIHGGKGYALNEGFKVAIGDLIGFTDADDSTSAVEFYKLIHATLVNGSDGAIASRKLPESIVSPAQPPMRQIASKCFGLLVRGMFGMNFSDTQCGAKCFTAQAAKDIAKLEGSSSWAWDVAALFECKQKGYIVNEVPIEWNDAEGSKVKIVRTSIRMFLSIARLRILHSPFKFIITIYNKMPGWMKIHHRI